MNLIYSNIELTKQLDKSNCITHSGKFHVMANSVALRH